MNDEIARQAESFAMHLMEEVLAKVFPTGDLGMDLTANAAGDQFLLKCAHDRGIEIHIANELAMWLEIDITFEASSDHRWLKVASSMFSVLPANSGEPFFRYDYMTRAHSVPTAHINVHGHRDDFVASLVGQGTSEFAKDRRRKLVKNGKLPRLANFHFPVGGSRFRPCIEDILESLIKEFGIDTHRGALEAIEKSRKTYHARQLSAAIRDNPEVAVNALQELGYQLVSP